MKKQIVIPYRPAPSNQMEHQREAPKLNGEHGLGLRLGVARPRAIDQPRGFALIVTISMLVLLVLLALGMLTLSSASTRSAQQDRAQMEAQSNARMALMLAIGKLQEEMGPDQRISANGSIIQHISHTNPHWLGVWDSWKAEDTDPENPDGYSAHRTIAGDSDGHVAPTYQEGREDHFRSLLVSLNPALEQTQAAFATSVAGASVMPTGDGDAVKLVASGSLGNASDDSDHVAVPLIPYRGLASSSMGRYGWWIGDQSQKASLMHDSYDGISLTDAQALYRQQSPGSTGTKQVNGLEDVVARAMVGGVPSYKTIDLLEVSPARAEGLALPSQLNFHDVTHSSVGVLADVREGGLKRDLNTLLERSIDLADSDDSFMLYRFDDEGQERVPIQDLAAYYQLYDDDSTELRGRKGGVLYQSGQLPQAIQVLAPDCGDNSTDKDKYLRQYTSLYRNPVPIGFQFIVALGATQITPEERDFVRLLFESGDRNFRHVIRDTDTHKLHVGVMPVVTLWNPNNIPMVIEQGNRQVFKAQTPPFCIRWKKYRQHGADYDDPNAWMNLAYAMNGSNSNGRAGGAIIQFKFAESDSIVFGPGEVKMFSLPATNILGDGAEPYSDILILHEPTSGWDPNGFAMCRNSTTPNVFSHDVVQLPIGDSGDMFQAVVFNPQDKLAFEIGGETTRSSRAASFDSEILGAGFHFFLGDYDYQDGEKINPAVDPMHYRNYQAISRFGGDSASAAKTIDFNAKLMSHGFPDRSATIPPESEIDAIPMSDIVSATSVGEGKAIMFFSMMAGCESSGANLGGYGGGRRITTRPFLHASTITAPIIDSDQRSSLYDSGWQWSVDRINAVEEAIQTDPDSGNGFYGGGYTAEAGVTRVIQQYLPVLPPISIAELSHAHLGGYSLARDGVMGDPDDRFNTRGHGTQAHPFRSAPSPGDFQQVTATGAVGLAPSILQAIGNSYAHPNIPADKAFVDYERFLNIDIAPDEQLISFVDHSYLANKALWDDYFMSSITPRPSRVRLHEAVDDLSAIQVAEGFFSGDLDLPNSRMMAYTENLSDSRFDDMKSNYDDYEGGFADQIAAHLMVKGAFNVNSTSVQAWKVFLSSLRDKPVAYLGDNNGSLDSFTPEDATPVAPGLLPVGEPIASADLSGDFNIPARQWTSWRSLTDQEIDQLAEAMVRQVKQRGPFLSLSEFINRRLDASNPELSLKGALQAALDDDDVDINAAFRVPERKLDGELDGMTAEFTEALSGPIAYGSTPYVDQADILRHLGSTLAPRGDTFVIRAYGDSLSKDGTVMARAWCEAVVQRAPEYVNSADAGEVKQADLQSEANKQFGRRFDIVSFRWLNSNEI